MAALIYLYTDGSTFESAAHPPAKALEASRGMIVAQYTDELPPVSIARTLYDDLKSSKGQNEEARDALIDRLP